MKHAVLVTDNEENCQWMADLLRHKGWTTEMVYSERSARVRLFAPIVQECTPDLLIITDICLPLATIEELLDVPEAELEQLDPHETGLRLCALAQEKLLKRTIVLCCDIDDNASHKQRVLQAGARYTRTTEARKALLVILNDTATTAYEY